MPDFSNKLFWLVAEKHLRRLTEPATRTIGTSLSQEEVIAKTFEMFSPVDYLEQIRKVAYQLKIPQPVEECYSLVPNSG